MTTTDLYAWDMGKTTMLHVNTIKCDAKERNEIENQYTLTNLTQRWKVVMANEWRKSASGQTSHERLFIHDVCMRECVVCGVLYSNEFRYMFRLNLAKCVAGFFAHINSTARRVRNRILRRRHIPHTIGLPISSIPSFPLFRSCDAFAVASFMCYLPFLLFFFFFYLVIVSGRQYSWYQYQWRRRQTIRSDIEYVSDTHKEAKNKRKFFHKYSWHIEATDKNDNSANEIVEKNGKNGVESMNIWTCGDRKWNANDSTMHFAAICSPACKYADNVLFGYFEQWTLDMSAVDREHAWCIDHRVNADANNAAACLPRAFVRHIWILLAWNAWTICCTFFVRHGYPQPMAGRTSWVHEGQQILVRIKCEIYGRRSEARKRI